MLIHFTTVHRRTDTRIRVKEVATLAKHFDEDVRLFVQDGLGHEEVEGYEIYDIGAPPQGRLRRMTLGAFRMYRSVLGARPRVAHFHDPELLPWGILLRMHGIKVIYDVHEDLPNQLRHKPYLRQSVSWFLARLVGIIEWLGLRTLTHIVVVVPSLQKRFTKHRSIVVSNFPSLEEFPHAAQGLRQNSSPRFVYVGTITEARGISEMIDAIELVDDDRARIHLLGAFSKPRLDVNMRARPGWQRVVYKGWSDREQVTEELAAARAGLVLLHPTPQYVASYPVKMFEYMAAGLPVIASDFPLWREIIAGEKCGLLTNPLDPQSIADSMQWILDHPDQAREMGDRGRFAIESRFNWEAESSKLVALYRRLLVD